MRARDEASANAAPLQAKWILRDGRRVQVAEDYEGPEPLAPDLADSDDTRQRAPKRDRDEPNGPPSLDDDTHERVGKRARTEATPPSPLDALDQIGAIPRLYGYLDVRSTANLARTSKHQRSLAMAHSVLPRVTGRRTIDGDDPQDLWSTDPQTADKRYFKPMSGIGETADVPHISEQTGFAPHLTDVASMPWTTGLGQQLEPGDYPSKLQFPAQSPTPQGYRLGNVNAPQKPSQGRVLVEDPNSPGSSTFIETKSYNKAKSDGSLPPSYPRTRLTSAQATRSFDQVRRRWEGAMVKPREKKQ